MFAPPEDFKQLRPLPWCAAFLVGFGAAMVLQTHGVAAGWGMAGVATAAALAAFGLGTLAVWSSAWGTRHAIIAAIATFFLFCLPWSIMLAPLVHGPSSGALSLAAGLLQCLVLVAASFVHARRARVAPQARKLQWPGCEIDLARRVVRKTGAVAPIGGRALPPLAIGAASVVLFQSLSRMFDGREMVVLALVVANAIAAWLCTGPLGRALGQGWRLHRIALAGGGPFVSDQLPRLTRDRQRFALGRLLSGRT